MRALLVEDNRSSARKALAGWPLCDHCLGRLFAKVETGLSNDERGRLLRASLGAPDVEEAACAVCEGLFLEVPEFVALAREALEPFEFETYLVGTRVDPDLLTRERELWEALSVASSAEPVNTELNREIGKRLAEGSQRRVDFKDPQITAIVDTRFNVVDLQHGGFFLFGRYRKFDRGLPQTVWPCRVCRGRGCDRCERTGKMYPESVQELVEKVAKEWTGATESAFHGAGREDVDARTLGTGRPFVLELKDPRRRTVDASALEAAINAHARPKVEVEGLRHAGKGEVVRVKEYRGTKTYRAKVAFAAAVAEENLFKAIAALRGSAIAQRTPSRVEHRRADAVRKRRVRAIEVEETSDRQASLRITGDAGLYIKELVSGDEGRTIPSLAGLLGVAATVEELDVLDVEYDEGGKRQDADPPSQDGALQP